MQEGEEERREGREGVVREEMGKREGREGV